MCFSATASFTAAGGLAVIGGVSLRRVRAPLAAIPLLFAAQQACEGFVWRAAERAPFHVATTPWGRAYLFFALLVWPAYVPLALWFIEPSAARRRALGIMIAGGVTLGLYLLARATLRDSNACIAFGNLYYWVQVDVPLKRLLLLVYLANIALALAVSSVRGTTVLGGVVLASFAVAALLYRAGFLSVWCFFAAVISGLVTAGGTPLAGRRPCH